MARVDLRGANLAGANFDGADLTAARLNKAAAPTATFRGARLVGADLEFARLFRADFSQADLKAIERALTVLEEKFAILGDYDENSLSDGLQYHPRDEVFIRKATDDELEAFAG